METLEMRVQQQLRQPQQTNKVLFTTFLIKRTIEIGNPYADIEFHDEVRKYFKRFFE